MAVQRLKEKPEEKNLKSTIKHWGYIFQLIREPQTNAEYIAQAKHVFLEEEGHISILYNYGEKILESAL